MIRKPTATLLVHTRRAWEEAASFGRKAQKKVIDEAAASCGMSYSNFTRHLGLNARKRSYSEAEEERMENVNTYARKVMDFVAQCEHDGQKITLRVAYNALLRTGGIPKEISEAMIYAACARLNLKNEALSVPQKFRGQKRPLGMVQIDYSKSKIFMFDEKGSIVFHPAVSKKNSRLWIGSGIDDYSRMTFFKYYITDGENDGFVRDVMIDIFEVKDNVDFTTGDCTVAKVLCGLPSSVYFDRGSGNKSKATEAGLKILGIKPILGMNEKDSIGRLTNRSNKKGRGKIERNIRSFKDMFESNLVAMHQLGELPPDISLDWLNEQARAFCEEFNTRKHPVLEGTKWDLFAAGMSEFTYPSEDARVSFATTLIATVYNRLIHVSKDLAFIAPTFCDDGDKVQVVRSGTDYYVWHGGARVKLKEQGTSAEPLRESRKSIGDHFEGLDLKEMIVAEIDRMSGGDFTLSSLPDDLADDKKEFFERPRTTEEIRLKAQYFVDVAIRQRKIEYEETV